MGKSVFGIAIVFGANSNVLTYGIVTLNGNTVFRSSPLTEQNFMLQITGRMSSLANPNLKNILKEKVLDTCDCVVDPLYKKYEGFDCYPFTILWKIKYKYHPREHHMKQYEENQGWAEFNYGPNKTQLDYIYARYKIKSLDDFIYGENLYQLLKDVQDTAWVQTYTDMR